MPVFITEASEEKPQLLFITSAHQLSEKVEGFFRQKEFEVLRVDPENISEINPQSFYRIFFLVDEALTKNSLKEVFSFLKRRAEGLSIIVPILTTISSEDPALSSWIARSNEQQHFLEKIEKNFPRANFFFLKDVVDLNPSPLWFLTERASGGELVDPQIALRPQALQDLWPTLEKYLLTPGEGKKILFQGEKQDSTKIVVELQQHYQQQGGVALQIIEHPAILIPDLFVVEKTQKIAKSYLSAAFQKYLKQLRVEEQPTPLELPEQQTPPELLQNSPEIPEVQEVQFSSPTTTARDLILPVSAPYIENRLKKYEKRMEEVVRLRQFRPYWQRSQAQMYQLRSTKDQTKKISAFAQKYEQDLDQEMTRLFGEHRTQRKAIHVEKQTKKLVREEKKNHQRQIFFFVTAGLIGIILGCGVLWGVFALTQKLLLESVVGVVEAETNQNVVSTTQDSQKLSRLGQFFSFQVSTYQYIFGKEKLKDQEVAATTAVELGEVENLQNSFRQTAAQAMGEFTGQEAGDLSAKVGQLGEQSGEAYQKLSLLQTQLKTLASSSFGDDQQKLFTTYLTLLQEERKTLAIEQQLQPILPELLGFQGKKTYALLLQNNQELRPTGGFLQSVALITVDKGILVDYQVYDVDSLDRLLNGQVIPPAEVQTYLGQKNWLLRDANWSANYPDAAKQISFFIEKTAGKKVDGIFAVNLFVLQDLLHVIGPVSLPEYNEVVNEHNLWERAEFHSEIQLVQTAKTEYLTLLLNRVLAQIMTLPEEKSLPLFSSIYTNLRNGQMLLYLDPSDQNSVFNSLGWSGEVGDPQCPTPFNDVTCVVDTIFQVEANVGVNKANYAIDRSIQHTISLSGGQVKHQRTIIFKNNASTEAWPMGTYKTYIRFYVPSSANLETISVNNQQVPSNLIVTNEENGKKYFGVLVEVPVQQTVALVLNYDEPLPMGSQFSYVFFEQKQAGTTKDPLTIQISADPQLHPTIVAPQADVSGSIVRFNTMREKST